MSELQPMAPHERSITVRELQGSLVPPEHLPARITQATQVTSTLLQLPAVTIAAPSDDDPQGSPYADALWQTFHSYDSVVSGGVRLGVTRTFDGRNGGQRVLSMGTYSADMRHNAPETAARAVLTGADIICMDPPAIGLSDALPRELRKYAMDTGRLTGYKEQAGESSFFAGVAKVMSLYGTRLLHGDSQGARVALAVMAHAEPGSVDRAFLNAPTGLAGHHVLGLTRRMLLDTSRAGVQDKKDHLEDAWRLDNLLELDVVSAVNEAFNSRPYQSNVTKDERLASLWSSLRSLARGPEHGEPFLNDLHAALEQQPGAQVTICVSENDLLYRKEAPAAVTRFLGQAALLGSEFSDRVSVVLLEGENAWPHAGWANRPSLWAAVGRHALELDS